MGVGGRSIRRDSKKIEQARRLLPPVCLCRIRMLIALASTESTVTITLEQFRQRLDETRVKCQFPGCNYKGHSISRHLREEHSTTENEYRGKYPDAKLTSKAVASLLERLSRKPIEEEIKLQDLIKGFESPEPKEGLKEFRANFQIITDPELMKLIPEIDPDFYFDPTNTKAMATAMLLGMHSYIEGPTGSGKTELARQIHAQLRQPIARVNMNGDVTASTFIGSKEVDVSKGTYYRYGILPMAMQRGYTLLCDEVDYTPPHIAAVLNPVLEKGGSLFLPDTGETITPALGFKVIATANTGGKGDVNGVYTGTEVLNTAFLDRFGVKLKADYLPSSSEEEMLKKRFPGADSSEIKRLVRLAGDVRTAFVKGELSVSLSTRKLIDLLTLERSGLTLSESIYVTLLNWLDEDDQNLITSILSRLNITI